MDAIRIHSAPGFNFSFFLVQQNTQYEDKYTKETETDQKFGY